MEGLLPHTASVSLMWSNPTPNLHPSPSPNPNPNPNQNLNPDPNPHPNPHPNPNQAADASLVGYSALEPRETRGSMLSTAYSIRFAFNVLAALAVALLYNGPESGGNFSWGLTLQQLLWLPVGFIGLLMGATLPMMHEEAAPKRRMRVGHRLVQVWPSSC